MQRAPQEFVWGETISWGVVTDDLAWPAAWSWFCEEAREELQRMANDAGWGGSGTGETRTFLRELSVLWLLPPADSGDESYDVGLVGEGVARLALLDDREGPLPVPAAVGARMTLTVRS